MQMNTSLKAPPSIALPIGLIVLAIVLATASRVVLSPLQELLRTDLGISDNKVALLQGLALALPVVVLAFPIGRMVDRIDRTKMIFVFALLTALASSVTAVSHSFAVIFVARMVVGISFSAIFLAALSLIADLSDATSRGRLVMLLFLGQVCGRSGSFALVGALIDRVPRWVPAASALAELQPWRLVTMIFAVLLLAGAFLMLLLKEPPRREVGAAATGGLKAAAREFWSYKAVLIPLLIGLATINMADTAAEIWAVPVLTRSFHQTPAMFGNWMGLVALIAGIGGAFAGGMLSDFGQRFVGRGGILIGAIIGAVVSIPGALFPLMPNVELFAIVLGVFLVAGSCNGAAAVAAATVLIPNEIRGVTSGVFAAISGIVANGVAPLLVSVTADMMGLGSEIAIPLTIVGVATSVIGSVAFVFSMRAARAPAGRVESVAVPVAA
jgi:MFS family permease